METDPTRMCEKLVGLGDVDLVGINDTGEGTPLRVVIRSRKPRPTCEACLGRVWSKGYRTAVLVDLPAFGRAVRLRWRKRRWTCPNLECAQKSFVEQDPHDRSAEGVADIEGSKMGDHSGGAAGPSRRGSRRRAGL